MQFGAVVLDARHFVPQSRPRVFMVAVDAHVDVTGLGYESPVKTWTPRALLNAHDGLPKPLSRLWRWWNLPVPQTEIVPVERLLEDDPEGVNWHTEAETKRLLGLMNDLHRKRIEEARRSGSRSIGFVYKRIRDGVQRAEVRFDGVAGCLRTPKGGSSRQTVIVVSNRKVKSRLLSPREAARLMGVPDRFKLPVSYNHAYYGMGDGVAVPVVSWLSQHLLEPLADRISDPESKRRVGVRQFVDRTHERAAGWTKEHNRVAPKELTDVCIAALEKWHQQLDENKSSGLDSFIANAGLRVADLIKEKWPLKRSDFVSPGGRFLSTSPRIQKILEQFGEHRKYTDQGGRTTGSCIPAAEELVATLEAIPEFGAVSQEDRAAVARAMQEWLYQKVVKPGLDIEGLMVEIRLERIPPDIIGDILKAAERQRISGAVAQHLVGAKLALRFPDQKIENHSHTTQDRQLGRRGDFQVGGSIFHITMTPAEGVVEKCAANASDGYEPHLLVPRAEVNAANVFVSRSAAKDKIWLQSIEDFVGQNIAEIATFAKTAFRVNLRKLLEKYNERVAATESNRAILIRIPKHLSDGQDQQS
jgi:hypothetical protein